MLDTYLVCLSMGIIVAHVAINNHKGVKFGPAMMDGMSFTAFARRAESFVALYHTLPVPLVSTSARNGAIIGLPCMGNAVEV